MKQFLEGIRVSMQSERLRLQAENHPSPETFLALSSSYEEVGGWCEAMEAARAGLKLFPNHQQLQDALKTNRERHSHVRAAELQSSLTQQSDPGTWVSLVDFYS